MDLPTFEEFLASRRFGVLGDLQGDDDQTPVLIYLENYFISWTGEIYHAILGNKERSGSLAELEKEIFEWAF